LLATFTEASAQPPCVVVAGASTFNLSELSGGAAPPFTATEPSRRGWVYLFSLCGYVTPNAPLLLGTARRCSSGHAHSVPHTWCLGDSCSCRITERRRSLVQRRRKWARGPNFGGVQ
jgi:hypothetical protein